jgi:hypothetical protein
VKAPIALAAAVATLAAAPAASAEPQTTQPNTVYTVPAVLTDKTIKLSERNLPRGAMIRYTGRQPRQPAVCLPDLEVQDARDSAKGTGAGSRKLGLPRTLRLPHAVSRQARRAARLGQRLLAVLT